MKYRTTVAISLCWVAALVMLATPAHRAAAQNTGGPPSESLEALAEGLSAALAEQMDGTETTERPVVAVLPFTELEGGVPDLGMRIAEELTTQLFLTRRFQVVERALLDKILSDHQLARDGILEPSSVSELGRLSNAAAIVTGTVADLGAEARFNARLISTTTGEVLAAASGSLETNERSTQDIEARNIIKRLARSILGPSVDHMVTYRVKQKVTVFQGDEQAQVDILSFYEFPDKYRSEIVYGSRMEVYIVNGSEARMLKGKVGKVKNAGIKEEKRDLLFASVRRDVINIARHSMNPDLTLNLQGTETINGTPCKIIDVVLDGVRSKLWIAEDGRALKQTFKEIGGKNKKPVPWELYFSEYKDWQGRKIPARWDIKVDGSRLEIVELEEWKENVDIDPRKFDVKE